MVDFPLLYGYISLPPNWPFFCHQPIWNKYARQIGLEKSSPILRGENNPNLWVATTPLWVESSIWAIWVQNNLWSSECFWSTLLVNNHLAGRNITTFYIIKKYIAISNPGPPFSISASPGSISFLNRSGNLGHPKGGGINLEVSFDIPLDPWAERYIYLHLVDVYGKFVG